MEEQIVATLNGTLQPDVNTIKAAEQHLRQVIHKDPRAGLALLGVVFAADSATISLPIRQAAAVNLSIWIKERWSPFFAEFIGFEGTSLLSNADQNDAPAEVALPVEYKTAVREALLNAFTLPETKLRGPLLKALINVASCDWPDEFPELLPRIGSILQAQDATGPEANHAIEGALAFLDEWFYTSMDETGLMSITRDLFPDLERILANESFSVQVRCHCVSILNQTLETLWLVKEQYPDVTKTVAQELLPKWLAFLEQMVDQDPKQIVARAGGFGRLSGEQLALQAQAWQTLITSTHFGTHFKPRLASLQAIALRTLTSLQEPFEQYHIGAQESSYDPQVDNVSFFATPSKLAAKLIDFLGVLMQRSKSTTDAAMLSNFVPSLCSFSRITSEEEEEWLENVSAFVAAGEDDEMGVLNSSMRGRCADILAELMMTRPAETLAALGQMAERAHQQSVSQRQASHPNWWKDEEAALALVGGVADHIIEQIEEQSAQPAGPKPFDIEAIFTRSVMPNIGDQSTQKTTPFFLQGRCFVFVSQFIGMLPSQLATSFMDAAAFVLEHEGGDEEGDAIAKLSAVRCIRNCYRRLSDDIVAPYTARILTRLAPLLLNANEDVLILIVETLQAVAAQREPIGQQGTSTEGKIPSPLYGEMASAAIQAWAREAMDRVLQSAIEDLLEAFAGQSLDEDASSTLQGAVPVLSHILQQENSSSQADGAKYRSGVVVEGALEFATALARGARSEALQSSNLVQSLFPPLFAVLATTEDREVYSNAARLLSTLIAKIPEQCLTWHDNSQPQATTSVQHILSLISRMISPEDSTESGGLAVGDLLSVILRKRPECLSSELPDICRAFVARLATASSTSLVQSLIIPLAFLMKDNLASVVGLLIDLKVPVSVDGQSTQPALEVLLRKWLEFASSMQGFWNARVSALGLCALFNARQEIPGVADVIDRVIVNGDLLPDDVNIIKTRSRSKAMPDKYTQVPIAAKIVKVLIAEFRQSTDGAPGGGRRKGGDEDDGLDENDDNDEGDDDGWDDDEEDAAKRKRQAFLSDMLGDDFAGDDDDEGLEGFLHKADEERYGDDAIWNMDFRTYLLHFFQHLSQDGQTASALAPYLNPDEVKTLREAVSV